MKSRNLIKATCLLMVGAMAAGSLFAVPRDVAASSETTGKSVEWNYQAEAQRLLLQVQSTATLLAREAGTLNSYARLGISRESHSNQVTLVKGHVNALGKHLARLQSIRHVSAPWQQQALDAVMPVAMHVAAHTEAAIQHLNDRGTLWDADYANHLRSISDRADQVKETIDLHLEMADTQDRLEQLRDRVNTLVS